MDCTTLTIYVVEKVVEETVGSNESKYNTTFCVDCTTTVINCTVVTENGSTNKFTPYVVF